VSCTRWSADIRNHITSPPGGGPHETCCNQAAWRTAGTHEAARSNRSLHALRGGWRIRAASNRVPGPKYPVNGWRRHRRFDPGSLRVVRHANTPFTFHQSPGGLPPPGCRGDAGFRRHHEDAGRPGCSTRSGRADRCSARKPSLRRDCSSIFTDRRPLRKRRISRRVAIGLPASWQCGGFRLLGSLHEAASPPRSRAASRGKPPRIRASFKARARSRDCEQSQRPSSSPTSRRGSQPLAASRGPRRERVCRAGTPAKRQPLRRRGCSGLFLDRGSPARRMP